MKFLDSTGVTALWNKIVEYIDDKLGIIRSEMQPKLTGKLITEFNHNRNNNSVTLVAKGYDIVNGVVTDHTSEWDLLHYNMPMSSTTTSGFMSKDQAVKLEGLQNVDTSDFVTMALMNQKDTYLQGMKSDLEASILTVSNEVKKLKQIVEGLHPGSTTTE